MRLPYRIRKFGQQALGGVPVRVLSGPNRGAKWSLVTLGRGFWTGRFEAARLAALESLVRAGECFWDVGAHKGYVTLAASRWVGPRGAVVAIEPSSTNLHFLRRHLDWNRTENVRVVAVALSDEAGKARFAGKGSSIAFRLGQGDEEVDVTTAEALVRTDAVPAPSVLKIDVEGEEAAVLRGADELLGGAQLLLVSTHGRSCYEECRKILLERGFRIFASHEIRSRSQDPRIPWASDHDFLAIGPDRVVDEREIRAMRLIGGQEPRSS